MKPKKKHTSVKTVSFADELSSSLKENNSDLKLRQWADRIINEQIQLADLIPLIHMEYPVAIRFSWMIGGICEKKPQVVFPCIHYFFSNQHKIQISNFDRSLAKMFWLCGIPAEIVGEVIDTLFKWVLDSKITVTTKRYALFALANYAAVQPGIKNELRMVIEDQSGKHSASFEKFAKKFLEQNSALNSEDKKQNTGRKSD